MSAILDTLFGCVPSFATGGVIGLIIGGIVGVFTTAILVAASRADDTMEALEPPLHQKPAGARCGWCRGTGLAGVSGQTCKVCQGAGRIDFSTAARAR